MYYIVDAIMGAGKTCAAINHINQSGKTERFIYITPYLKEVERIRKSCKEKKFVEPVEEPTKSESLRKLLRKGKNIATTHRLFEMFDDGMLELINHFGYTLVMDEAASVVNGIGVTTRDAAALKTCFLTQTDTGAYIWADANYAGVFEYVRDAMMPDGMAFINNEEFVVFVPTSRFAAFKDVYILTYMFECQMQAYYFQYHGIQYTKLSVVGDHPVNYSFIESSKRVTNSALQQLITVFDSQKANVIGKEKFALSVSWYKAHIGDAGSMTQLGNNCTNFFQSATGYTPHQKRLWTVFKDAREAVQYNAIIFGKRKDKTKIAKIDIAWE